jgi:hypothetical protein
VPRLVLATVVVIGLAINHLSAERFCRRGRKLSQKFAWFLDLRGAQISNGVRIITLYYIHRIGRVLNHCLAKKGADHEE